MPAKLTRVLDKATTTIVAVVIALTLIVIGPKFVGISAYAVLSGSMEPDYPTGSLVYVKATDTTSLHEGDVITYMVSKNTTVTHRIESLTTAEDGTLRFETKGDANDQPDSELVHPDNVLGKTIFCIPFLGYTVNFVTHSPGSYIALSALALVVMLLFLPDLFAKSEEDEKEQDEKDNARADGKSVASGKRKMEVPRGSVVQGQPYYRQAGQLPAQYNASARTPYQQTFANQSMPYSQNHLTPEQYQRLAQQELARRAAARQAPAQTQTQRQQQERMQWQQQGMSQVLPHAQQHAQAVRPPVRQAHHPAQNMPYAHAANQARAIYGTTHTPTHKSPQTRPTKRSIREGK